MDETFTDKLGRPQRYLSQTIFNIFVCLLMSVPILAIITQNFLGFSTPFMFILYILTIMLGVIYFIIKKKVKIPFFLWLLIPYFFYKFIADYSFNENYLGSLYLTLRYNLSIVATFFGLLIIFNSTIKENFLKLLYKYIAIVIIVAPIFTIVQVFNPFFMRVDVLNGSSSLYYLRRYSFFGYEDPNALGFTYLPLVFAFIGSHYLQRKKILLIIYLMCIGVVLILSNTRYIMFGLVMVFFQLVLVERRKLVRLLPYLLIFSTTILLILYFFNYIGYNFLDFYNARLDDQGNIKARLISFTAFTHIFPDYFLFGVGYEKAPIIVQELHGKSPIIHVGFLNHLIVYGVIGSSLLFTFWIGLFSRYLKRAKRVEYWGAVIALVFFFSANLSLVMYSIFFSGLLLCLVIEKGTFHIRLNSWRTQKVSKY
jgi:hypothetical protein